MKTKYKTYEGIPPEFCKDPGKISSLTAALPSVSAPAAGRTSAPAARIARQYLRGRPGAYTPKTQPRQGNGRFRKILARLKQNLGEDELEQIASQIQKAEEADTAGDYTKATEASRNIIKMVDDIEEGALDPDQVKNLRAGSADLGRVLAYLPMPQGEDAKKVRYSDLPPSTSKFIDDMISRVQDQINSEDAAKYTKVLRSFISGVRSMSSDELSAELAKLLRLLT